MTGQPQLPSQPPSGGVDVDVGGVGGVGGVHLERPPLLVSGTWSGVEKVEGEASSN